MTFVAGGHRRSRRRWRGVFADASADRGAQSRRRDARRSVDRRSAAVHRHQHRRHVRAARGGAARSSAALDAGGARGVPLPARVDRRGLRHARARAGSFSEETPYAPNSPYAASKAAADHLVRAYFHTYGLPVLITNCSNNYGPFQFPEKLIPLMILNALDGRPLPIYGDGGNVRDWLHVEDHCAGILLVLAKGRARREVQHRRRQRADEPRDRRSHLRRARGAAPGARRTRRSSGVELSRPEDVRARSAGSRSPLRDRRDEDPPRARLGAAPRVRGRAWPRPRAGTSSTATGASRSRPAYDRERLGLGSRSKFEVEFTV